MKKWKMNTGLKVITKAYKEYNDLYNEGGEGYVPADIKKYENSYKTVERRMIAGKEYTVDQAIETLQKLEASLPKWEAMGDAKKIQGCTDLIQSFASVLQEVA